MGIKNGQRIPLVMSDTFWSGVFATDVKQAEDYDEKTGRRSPARDKVTGELVWNVTVIDRDPETREKQVTVKVTAPYQPVLPGEIAPGTGLHAVEFVGLTGTAYIVEGGPGRRARIAWSYRATDMVAQGKAPAVPAPGRAGGASGPGTPSTPGHGPGSGEGKAA